MLELLKKTVLFSIENIYIKTDGLKKYLKFYKADRDQLVSLKCNVKVVSEWSSIPSVICLQNVSVICLVSELSRFRLG